ncbi:hypothetical protein ACP43V_03935 [Vibrio genomosp. F10 str. 9ZC157]|uniref:hypothetical protein n=1 Tax=Vibrio genomosp. F10 TaxID=723171 RepID=UPI0002D88655|nr:hypothetical protein [Vibrio genomosp. F10]OEE97486.1 hypothetical protein A1QM_14675 [Vibrio genomosp. F10 str. 9ZC157]
MTLSSIYNKTNNTKRSISIIASSIVLAFSAGTFSSNAFSADTLNDTHLEVNGLSEGEQIFQQYGIDDDLPKLGLSSLVQGEHLVEHATRFVQVGNEVSELSVFLIKNTDTKGNIDLRVKYNADELANEKNMINEIENYTRTEYRLRNYAQSYDPKSVRATERDDGVVEVKFNYSKYGLPQDIAYFRFLTVTIEVKDSKPLKMTITNSKPFQYGKYAVDSYQQTITFAELASGKVIIAKKDIEATGSLKNKSVKMHSTTEPVAFYEDDLGVSVLNEARLAEVSDPRVREVQVKLDSVFPLMGDMVRRQGIDIPLPYGVSVAYRNQNMDFGFTDFNVMGTDLNDLFDATESIGSVKAESLSIRGDVNILPFWNVFGVVGKVNVDANVDAQYTGGIGQGIKDKLNDKWSGLGDAFCDIESIGALCNSGRVNVPLHLEYDVMGVGTTLSVGYREFFASVTGTYTATRLKGSDNWGEPIATIQPMLGYQLVDYRAQIFVGAEYQGLKSYMDGTLDGIEIGGKTFNYHIGVDMEPWAYLVGFNKQIGKHYNLTFLYNTGETRSAATLNLGYRF